MEYRKKINSYEPIKTRHNTGYEQIDVLLEVSRFYKVVHAKPANKKDRMNNGRIVEILGFTDDFCGEVIVRYKDNNRIGRVRVNCLMPI
ncbi:MAG TPA: hypothetical protein DCG34_10035 [Clostridiales bacterium]|nr:hypothetical protein [Clostridiales bacterium]